MRWRACGTVNGMDLALALSIGSASGGNDPPEVDPVFLTPGAGYSGPTAHPAPIGDPAAPGFSAKSIVRWSCVPFQVVKDQLRIGAIAFHMNGIEKVSFCANGGAWLDVLAPTVNPSTGVSEYWVTLRASDFTDGKVEVRAIAWPKTAGTPRILQGDFQETAGKAPPTDGVYSYLAWTNANGLYDRVPKYVSGSGDDNTGDGSLSAPFLTLSKATQSLTSQYGSVDGCTIYCLPGEFSFQMKWGSTFATANERAITIATAPGITQDQVTIVAARPKTLRMHLKNVTIGTDAAGNFYVGYSDCRPSLWFDNVKVSPVGGRYGATAQVLITCAIFVTDTTWTDSPDGPLDCVLVRNTVVTKLKSDMVSGCQVVINVQGSDIDPGQTGAHPDIYQIYRPTGMFSNNIVYGLRANNFLAQGIFIAALPTGASIQDCAFVNVVLDPIPSNFTSQLNKPADHLLMVNCTLDQTFFLRAKGFTNCAFAGNIYKAVTLDLAKTTPADIALIDWKHNHFVDSTSYGTYTFGTDITTGPAPVINWAMGNFQPIKDSLLTSRMTYVHCKYDVSGASREPMTSIGALEHAE